MRVEWKDGQYYVHHLGQTARLCRVADDKWDGGVVGTSKNFYNLTLTEAAGIVGIMLGVRACEVQRGIESTMRAVEPAACVVQGESRVFVRKPGDEYLAEGGFYRTLKRLVDSKFDGDEEVLRGLEEVLG